MQTLSHTDAIVSAQLKNRITAAELLTSFDHYANKIKVLSLDCFDTLLWRKTAQPKDVFYDLQHRAAFQEQGISALTRINSELLAYRMSRVKHANNQATLAEIYRCGWPHLTQAQSTTLIQNEIASEIDACYVFPPIIALMRAAHAKGIKIIIVSDTYFDKPQLRYLLENKLPPDVMQMIEQIYCSCETGKSKSAGLFNHVLNQLKLSPHYLLHIGDNQIADFDAPRSLGLNALHLIHHSPVMAEIMRMHAVAASFIDPTIRVSRSLTHPFRGLFASQPLSNTPESITGYVSIGPIMYAFARFLRDEIADLQGAGKRPKVLFLMRDAYLPSLVCEALMGQPAGTCVRISRFASFAASFRTIEDVDRYLADRIQSLRFHDMCNQLLLPEKIANQIITRCEKSASPGQEFLHLIREEKILRTIFQNSKDYCARLKKHLQNTVNLEAGDTLVFVDLGYSGTAQNKLEPIFRDEMNVEIVGRYLIALRTPDWTTSRRGLLDPTTYADTSLVMLVTYIALLEQICTSTENSLVDFDEDGHPIYSETSVNESQHEKLKAIQAECIRFTRDAETFFRDTTIQVSSSMLRDYAAASLGRFLFLPTEIEIEYLQTFQFDLNLGTKEILPIIDLNQGLTSLRRRTWLYCQKENLEKMRTNYAAEWRVASLELALTLMAQHRFGFEFSLNDLNLRKETVHLILLQGQHSSEMTLEAQSTIDGYYALLIPISQGHFQIGIRFGFNYQWVEIESAELIKLTALFTQNESEYTHDASANLLVDQMDDKGGGLFECLSDASLLIFAPNEKMNEEEHVLRIVFRPLVRRGV